MNNSIYISICCLGVDKELELTITSALKTISRENYVSIGLACIGRETFFQTIKTKFKGVPNLSLVYATSNEIDGISQSRNLAASLYNMEDYFLQVDSHTLFSQNWDKHLIETLTMAQSFVNNDKTIISGGLPAYSYFHDPDKTIKLSLDKEILYIDWEKDYFWGIPYANFVKKERLSPKLQEYIKRNAFSPCPKISAGFLFGNNALANHIEIEEKLLFWEEQPIQSMNLIEKGFCLVQPDSYPHLNHFYGGSDDLNKSRMGRGKERAYFHTKSGKLEDSDYGKEMSDNFTKILNNPKKSEIVRRYQEYTGIDLKTGVIFDENRPSYFINSTRNDKIFD
jgi:hypothetical protein